MGGRSADDSRSEAVSWNAASPSSLRHSAQSSRSSQASASAAATWVSSRVFRSASPRANRVSSGARMAAICSHHCASVCNASTGGGTCASDAFAIALRIPASPASGRGPRRHQRSSARARARNVAPSCPRVAKGCFSSASSGTGAKRACAASASRHRNAPAVACARGRPAESSIVTPQRAISAATRRARLRSGVTSAAVRCGVSSASRNASAIASASCAGSAAATKARLRRPSRISPPPLFTSARQASVVGAGRRLSRSNVSRGAFTGASYQSLTSARSAFMVCSSRRKPNCG